MQEGEVKKSNYYIISDTHFCHEALISYGARPENNDIRIINNWKSTVQSKDIVFHLGDIGFCKQLALRDILRDLPGTIIMVRGNHDKKSNNWYIDAGVAAVVDSVVAHGILLSHKPIKDSGVMNIHGHFHNCKVDKWEPELKQILNMNHRLFSVEECGYKPILLQKAKCCLPHTLDICKGSIPWPKA